MGKNLTIRKEQAPAQWMNLRKNMLTVMQAGDRQEIRNQLALYKDKGTVVYERTLLIPSSERIQAIASLPDGRKRVSAALSASIKSAVDSLNLRLGLSIDQILDLTDEIIDQSAEDNLSLEDVLLFLQMLITGKAGKIYDRMDIPTFFEMFEVYRQERHEAIINYRDEQAVNHRAAGDNTRSETGDPESIRATMMEYKKQEFLKHA